MGADYKTVILPYGTKTKRATLPRVNFGGFFTVRQAAPLARVEERLSNLLADPTGVPSLAELVQGCKRVLIVCDDNTRRTPADLLLPLVLAELNKAGVRDGDISILFAAGSHRPMTRGEIEGKIGIEISRRIAVNNHDYKGDLVYKGRTSLGTPIYVNRLVEEADFVLGIGNIIPHRYCGWAGGGKIIQPGVCGEETISRTHLLLMKDPNIKLGSKSNMARKEINEVARAVGLKFIINTILNGEGQVVDIVAGDVEKAHDRGIDLAEEVYGVSIPEADVVVLSSHPEDANLWQSLKALYAADLVVREGGTVVLVTPLYEGVGEHVEFVGLLGFSSEEIKQKLERGEVEDLLSGAAAYAGSLVSDRSRIILNTDGIDDRLANRMGFGRDPVLQRIIDDLVAENPGHKFVFIREGTEILPIRSPREGYPSIAP